MKKIILIFNNYLLPTLLIPLILSFVTLYYQELLEDKTFLMLSILLISNSIAVIYVALVYNEITKNIKDIGDRAGTNAELLQYGKNEKYKTPFGLPIQLIKNAQSEILILDYFPWPGFSKSDPKIKDIGKHHNVYYDELIKAATKKNAVSYHRIVQIPQKTSPKTLNTLFKNDIIKKHFSKMIELMNNNQSMAKVSIKTCKMVYPTTTFIIIDKRHVIWEIPYLIDEKDFKFDLDLYIVDSQGKLAEKLIEKFSKLSDIATPLKL